MTEPRDRTDRSGDRQIRERLKPERIQGRRDAEPVQAQTDQLEPERIQAQLKPERIQARLKPERIQAHLAELPGWRVGDGGGSLVRTYEFPTARASALFVQLVTEIGDAAGYLPDVDLRHLQVTVAVATSQDEGLYELDVTIARMLDSRLEGGVGRSVE